MKCPWGDINWFRDQYVREGDACSLRANPDPATNLGTDIANFGGQEETSFEGNTMSESENRHDRVADKQLFRKI